MYNNITTQRRRAEQLRQIIRLITGDEFLDFPNGYLNNMIMNYDKKIKIDYYVEEVFKQLKADDEKDGIVAFQFLFYLGLNIYQISKIKIKSFKMKSNDTLFLNLKYNRKKLQRKINIKTKINIELLVNIGNLNNNDYIVFPYIRNLTNNSRYIYLYSYCSKKINENKKLTFEIKEKFSKYLSLERKTKKYKFKSIDDTIIFKEFKDNFPKEKTNLNICCNDSLNFFDKCKEDWNFSQISDSILYDIGRKQDNEYLSFDLKGNNFISFDFNEEFENYDKTFHEIKDNSLIYNKVHINEKNQNIIEPYDKSISNNKNINKYETIKPSPLLVENINFKSEMNSLNKLKLEMMFEEINLTFIDEPFSPNEYLLYPLDSNKN